MDIKRIFTQWPFRTKLLLLLLIIFLPAVGIIVFSGLSHRKDEIVRARNNALLLTQSLAAQQEQIAIATKTMLSTLAHLPEVTSLDAAACDQLFRDLNQQYPFYTVILAVKPDGTVFAASSPFEPNLNLSDRKHVKDAIRTHDFSVGEYIVGRVSKVFSLNYTFPVLDAKKNLVAILIAGFKLNEFGRFLSAVNLPEGSVVLFTDHKGIRLYRLPENNVDPIGKQVLNGYFDLISGEVDEGFFEWKAMDGINRIWAYKQLRLKKNSAPYLYINVGQPKDPILHKANMNMLVNLSILGIATLLALSLAWVFGKLVLINPINRLVAATQRFGMGEMDTRTGLPHSPDELGGLARSFDDMASLLETRNIERERAEETLRQSEEKYRQLVQQVPAVVYKGYTDWSLECFDQKIEEITGYSMEEFNTHQKTWLDMIFPEDVDQAKKLFKAALKGDGSYVAEHRIRKETGEVRWIQARNRIIRDAAGKVDYISGVFFDITERKRVEDELKKAHDYLENIFVNSADGIGIVDRHGKFTLWNKAAEEMYGYMFETLKGRSGFDLYADRKDIDVMLKQLRQHGFIRNYEINMKKKDGSVFPASLSIKILRNSDNEIIGSVTLSRDLSEAKQMMMHLQNEIYQHEQARQAMLDSEQKFVNIIDFLPDATFVIDTKGKVIAWNKAIEEMSGVKTKDMVGKGNYEYALPFYGERRPILIDLVLDPDGIEKYGEVTREDRALMAVVHLNNFKGKETYQFAKATALIDLNGNIIGSIESIRDITALRKAETDRLQFSKLESMSILAGGIAHDFNNILTAILGNIGLAMLDEQRGPRVQERLVQAEQACLRAQALSQQLLTFAKGGAPIKKIVSISKLLKEAVGLTLSGSKSRCEFSIPDDLWSVEADEGQINQVISNLLINADQAMPEGGIIRITAENILVEAESNLPILKGKYVKFAIADQGIGISPNYLDKIFDPYFSTKQKGSGLGLATAYSIIKNHSGYIQVESQTGVGTTFHIYLPATDKRVPAAEPETVKPAMGQGKVLVMDDEEMVRAVLGSMLASLGYEADFASDGSQAIENFVKAKETNQPFAAVILDLTIPGGMGGKEAIKELLKVDPQVKAIVSSGYSDAPIMADFQKFGFAAVIAKPYRVSELSKILQRVISGKKAN